ncbi:MAG: DUF2332 domain-containing protein [Deltaproteobacteria bacterium]|nr:DUF2332 domain-containing protein [Deltaproteobacteria bacterium]
MEEIQNKDLKQKMGQWFLRFSDQVSGSPMYRYLSIQVSADDQCLALACGSEPSQPAPNLFFAAVHFLLEKNRHESLAKYYPSLGGGFESTPEMFECFKGFCQKFEFEILEILKTKLVQTNEVQRCAVLWPALKLVGQMAKQSNVALIDVGTSGGLSFLMDKAHLTYSDGAKDGPEDSPLRLHCESRGGTVPTLTSVNVKSRIGIDLNPVDLLSENEKAWNLALIWPDQLDRRQRIENALQLLKTTAIDFQRGAANQVLPSLSSKIPNDQLLCVLHSFSLNQFSSDDRVGFDKVLETASLKREIWRIGLEWLGTKSPELVISKYGGGQRVLIQKIAECGGHGEWIHWQPS